MGRKAFIGAELIFSDTVHQFLQVLTLSLRNNHNRKPHVCEFCDKEFIQERDFERHSKMHFDHRAYLCRICWHSFGERSEMTEHRDKHAKVKEFQCVECFKEFESKRNLSNHVYKNHRIFKEVPCSICGILYKSANDLKKHEEYHEGLHENDVANQGPYTCRVCGKVLKHQTSLTTHMRLHMGEKFQCSVCGKEYTSKRGLKDHIVIKHERKGRFKCQLCGKAFADQTPFDVHKTTHLKPLKCQVCQQGYKTEMSLKRHNEKEHNN